MGTGICQYCGKATVNGDFFTVQQRNGTREQRFAHIACMVRSGERLIKGIKLDDVANGEHLSAR